MTLSEDAFVTVINLLANNLSSPPTTEAMSSFDICLISPFAIKAKNAFTFASSELCTCGISLSF